MANLYLFKYNNYHNKILKVQQTIEGYGDPLSVTQSTNFNPNDGITTQHVVNTDFSVIPDYCVVMSDYGEIESRWFVMSCKRIRKGQWRVELLRDSLAEYRSQVLEAVCFIEKGYVNNANPLVFNNENMGFNQIKSGEYLLKNDIESPWLVLYLARYDNDGNFNKFSGSLVARGNIKEDYNKASLNEYEYYAFSRNQAGSMLTYSYIDRKNPQFIAEYRRSNQQSKIDAMGLTNNSFTAELNQYDYPGSEARPKVPVIEADKKLEWDESMIKMEWGVLGGELSSGQTVRNNLPYNTYLSQYLTDYHIQFGSKDGFDKLLIEDKKIIKVGSKYYEIEVINNYQSPVSPVAPPVFLKQNDSIIFSIDSGSGLGDQMKSVFFTDNGIEDIPDDAIFNFKIQATVTNPILYIDFHEITVVPINYDIKYDAVYTKDAPYEILAAPLNNVTFTVPKEGGGSKEFNHDGNIAKQVFQEIINKYHAAGFAYDLQIVPYCPINSTDITLQTISYFIDSTSEESVSCCIYLQTSTFTQTLTAPEIPIRSDYKMSNELDLYRVVSPNGVGEFEFSPSKNGGNVEFYEVDCTLIPYNPYIKINPLFSGLYGADYDDYRGLICGGDFSMPIVSNEWETYQLQNKYYQDIFNRQISHQEYNNKFSLASDILGATAGAVSAGVEGFTVGGGVGAAVSAGVSLLGGAADVVTNQMLRNEEIRYQKDQFGFQLGTIKARAESLTRSTSFNQNNKYFPYVEYYTCTKVEEDALKKKIEYNGMTVGVIGKISDYLSPTYEYTYVQAQLIEIDIPDDYQMVEEIARRLRGGIRIA